MLVDNRCSSCKGEMFLDHVSEIDGKTVIFYSCINPNCKEKGKAYSAEGTERQSQIKTK